ncbi:MAG: hypothetical protein Tsb0020_54190 [Haliangiales bacterium]
MQIRTREILKLYRLPMGRLVFALSEVGQRAAARGLVAIAGHAERGAAEGRRALDLSMRNAAAARRLHAEPETGLVDSAVDGAIVGLDGLLVAQERAFADEPRGAAAGRLRRALLPRGVRAVTSLPYAQQHEQVDALLRRARSPELADNVAEVPEVAPFLERIGALNERYGEVLRMVDESPTRAEINAAEDRADDILSETVAAIVAHFAMPPASQAAPTNAADVAEARDALLEPIWQQNEALRQQRRRRRQPLDVDPESGVELPEVPGDADEGLSPVDDRLDDNNPGSGDDVTPSDRGGGGAPERAIG